MTGVSGGEGGRGSEGGARPRVSPRPGASRPRPRGAAHVARPRAWCWWSMTMISWSPRPSRRWQGGTGRLGHESSTCPGPASRPARLRQPRQRAGRSGGGGRGDERGRAVPLRPPPGQPASGSSPPRGARTAVAAAAHPRRGGVRSASLPPATGGRSTTVAAQWKRRLLPDPPPAETGPRGAGGDARGRRRSDQGLRQGQGGRRPQLQCRAGLGDRLPRPQRRRQDHHPADAARTGHPDLGDGDDRGEALRRAERSRPHRGSRSGGDQLPSRPHRPQPPTGMLRRRRGGRPPKSTSCSSWSVWPPPAGCRSRPIRWGCASA